MSVQSNSKSLRQAGTYALVVVTSVGITLGLLRLFPKLLPQNYLTQKASTVQIKSPYTNKILDNQPRNFVSLAVSRVGQAVVRIDTERTIRKNYQHPFFGDPFFREFFGRGVPQPPQEFRQQGQGSGFIIDAEGIILTNAHVVSDADKVTIKLKDGRTFAGEVKGVDEFSDLAVVKIEGENLPVAPLGDSSNLQVGDWAIAVGNPLGLDNTVTLGIISTLKRSSAQVGIPDKRLDFIQTDTAINPGNSGGPLLNDRGEVIGINTAIRAGAEGIGFAIPINKAKSIQDQLINGETVPHPYIGIQMLTLNSELAQQFNQDPNSLVILPEIKGVLVVRIMPNSPADKGGLRKGDVITKVGEQKIETAEQLQEVVEQSEIGKPLPVKVRRGRENRTLSVRPAEIRQRRN